MHIKCKNKFIKLDKIQNNHALSRRISLAMHQYKKMTWLKARSKLKLKYMLLTTKWNVTVGPSSFCIDGITPWTFCFIVRVSAVVVCFGDISIRKFTINVIGMNVWFLAGPSLTFKAGLCLTLSANILFSKLRCPALGVVWMQIDGAV